MSRDVEWLTHVVYVAYNEDGSCAYVGMTADLNARLDQHRATYQRWAWGFGHIDYTEVPDRTAARVVEAWTIWTLRPWGNRQCVDVPPAYELSLDDALSSQRWAHAVEQREHYADLEAFVAALPTERAS